MRGGRTLGTLTLELLSETCDSCRTRGGRTTGLLCRTPRGGTVTGTCFATHRLDCQWKNLGETTPNELDGALHGGGGADASDAKHTGLTLMTETPFESYIMETWPLNCSRTTDMALIENTNTNANTIQRQ